MTRKDAVLEYMREHGSITSMEAFQELGNTRLSASIFLLKKDGHAIAREDVTATDRRGEKVRFARYHLVEDEL